MFGDLFNIKAKLEQAKQSVMETRERLNTVFVQRESLCGAVVVRVTANKQVDSIQIDPAKLKENTSLEKILTETLNAALTEAGEIQEYELKRAFTEHLPDIPGLDNLIG
jgi:DNA-binding protein YbaB